MPHKITATEQRKSKMHKPPQHFVDIHMSGFPDHTAPIFIEVENEKGESVNFGEWIKREDGAHVLRIAVIEFGKN